MSQTSQPHPQPSIPAVPATIGVSVSITLGVSAFFVKWMFERLIQGWDKRLADLESTNQSQISQKEFQVLDARFTAIAQSFASLQGNYQEVQRELIKLRGEYLPREDWVRLSSAIESKIEAMAQKMQLALSEGRSEADGRAKAIEDRLETTRTAMGDLRSQIATEYVRREDWVRFVTTIDAKMDAIARRMDEQLDRLSDKLDNNKR